MAWKARRGPLSAAHKAKISASLKAKGRGAAISSARAGLRKAANAPKSTYNRAAAKARAVIPYRRNRNPATMPGVSRKLTSGSHKKPRR